MQDVGEGHDLDLKAHIQGIGCCRTFRSSNLKEPGELSAPASNLKTAFRYIKEVMTGNTAVLEFERTIAGKYMNGIDIITVDDDGKIIEFKVMVRPLQAVNALHRMMGAMLEKMKDA